MEVLEAVESVNDRQKQVLFAKLVQRFGSEEALKGKTVAVWGLAFKPETDDTREAPALILIEQLLGAGANVRAYDPIAMEETRRKIGDSVTYCSDIYDAAQGADAVVLVTEWKEFRLPSWETVKENMRGNLLVDGRNIYDPEEMVREGFEYTCIGRK